jgi:hypothetical protein
MTYVILRLPLSQGVFIFAQTVSLALLAAAGLHALGAGQLEAVRELAERCV